MRGTSTGGCTPARRPVLRARYLALFALDAGAWAVGIVFADIARYDFRAGQLDGHGMWTAAIIAVAVQGGLGTVLHLYRARYRVGSFDEVQALVTVSAGTGLLVLAVDLLSVPRLVPASVPVMGGVVALTLMCAVRYVARAELDKRRRPHRRTARPLLVFGAGEGGQSVVTALLRDRRSGYLPVGLLDDDPRKRNLRVAGVPVLGGRQVLIEAAGRLGVSTLLIALPSADPPLLRELTGLADQARLAVKVLPPVSELIDGRVGVSDIRDLDIADLLGRGQVDTDLEKICGYLAGKRVLVTGAGGSIGSELCRQIREFGPAELVMVDRDESALHAVQLSLHGRALLQGSDTVLADIRDVAHLNQIFAEHRPQVVFHAAALKHLPLLERYPGEAVKTNVWGTLAVLNAAAEAGVERFVNVSTDKAANPVCVLGYSKRITERLTAAIGARHDGVFVSVRFGNVLGSRGSVLTAFTAQVAAGGPITVTDPEITRFFMTVQEAVQLVIQAGALAEGGGVLVLDMGEPVRIADVARRLAAQAPREVEIVYTGLRPGEKLHEELFGRDDQVRGAVHPLITEVGVPLLDPIDGMAIDPWADPETVRDALRTYALGRDVPQPWRDGAARIPASPTRHRDEREDLPA